MHINYHSVKDFGTTTQLSTWNWYLHYKMLPKDKVINAVTTWEKSYHLMVKDGKVWIDVMINIHILDHRSK